MATRVYTGAQKIVEAFTRRGIKHVFIFPGGTIAPILDYIEKKTKIEIVCPRTEQGAGYAALAYAKLTGKAAVFMVTSGPGVTNAVTPIADAYYDNVPLVVLTGQVGTADMRGTIPVKQRGFQEVDTVDIMKPISKAAFLVKDVRELPDMMEQAFFLAETGRAGPVVIDLPMNVQRAVCALREFFPVKKRNFNEPKLQKAKVEVLAGWIKKAQRPVILVGGGALTAGAQKEIRTLAERYRIPVGMSLPGIGGYPTDKPLSLGLVGYAGSQYANLAMYHSDLLLCIGTTLHLRQTGSLPAKTAPGAKIARIDIDANELKHSRVPLDLKIHADAKEALASLNATLSRRGRKNSASLTASWLKTIDAWKETYALTHEVRRGDSVKPQKAIEAADRAVRRGDVIVTTGVGQHQIWVPRHFNFDYPKRQLLTSSGHGTMGFDLPAAIGAKIASPKSEVLCVVGDGSLQMNIQELATIADLKLDIKILVLDNHALNIVAQFQRQNWKSHPATGDRFNPDFADIARAYGIWSVQINSNRTMERKIKSALKRRGPALIHCIIDEKEDLIPMLLGGQTLDNMSFASSHP